MKKIKLKVNDYNSEEFKAKCVELIKARLEKGESIWSLPIPSTKEVDAYYIDGAFIEDSDTNRQQDAAIVCLEDGKPFKVKLTAISFVVGADE